MQASGKEEPVSLAVFNCIFFITSSHYIPFITLHYKINTKVIFSSFSFSKYIN